MNTFTNYAEVNTQIGVQNVQGNIIYNYNGENEDVARSCLAALWQTAPSLTDPTEDRQALIRRKGERVAGTCEWITRNSTYQSWLDSSSPLLWISGGPGKGKTMLAIYLAESLEQTTTSSSDRILLQYFCDNKDDKRNSAMSILRSFVFQLIRHQPNAIESLLPFFEARGQQLFLKQNFEALWNCFTSMVMDLTTTSIYCIVDGLDEVETDLLEVFLKRIKEYFVGITSGQPAGAIHLIAISREQPDILATELAGFARIRLDPDANELVVSDIERFINTKVSDLATINCYPEKLRNHVEAVFRRQAEGSFLWIGLVASQLQNCSLDEVSTILASMPQGLDALYTRILNQIVPRRQEMAKNILMWVAMAYRPLTLDELGTAIDASPDPLLDMSIQEMTLMQVKHCEPLLSLTSTDKGYVVDLVHQSAKDYLLVKHRDHTVQPDPFHVKEEEANFRIASRCLRYLQTNAPEGVDLDEETRHARRQTYPLLEYSHLYWTEHARQLTNPLLDIFDLSLPFYASESHARHEQWLNSQNPQDNMTSIPLLHFVSYFGLSQVVQKLLTSNWRRKLLKTRVNMKAAHYSYTALHFACLGKQKHIIEILLKQGANPNIRGYLQHTPFTIAMKDDNVEIAQLLCANGADVNLEFMVNDEWLVTDFERGYPRYMALYVHVLYGNNRPMYEKITPLMYTARRDQKDMVQVLLAMGANINVRSKRRATALMLAVHSGSKNVIPLLLAQTADIDIVDQLGRSVLMMAVGRGDQSIVQTILVRKPDLNLQARGGDTALHMAMNHRRYGSVVALVMTKMLLLAGADQHIKNDKGQTPLDMAEEHGYTGTVTLLRAARQGNLKDQV